MTDIKETLENIWADAQKQKEELKDRTEEKIDELMKTTYEHKVDNLEDKIEVLKDKVD